MRKETSYQINCLVVDDEPVARQIIQNYCKHLPDLQIKGLCKNAFEAKSMLQTHAIQLIFLDINLPALSGIAFLKTMSHPPEIIFTTAYKEYAVDAFDLAACDYLIKPFSLDRFMIAVDKAKTKLLGAAQINQVTIDSFYVKSDGKIYKILLNEFLFAEAHGNYTKIVTEQNTLLANISFSAFEESLPDSVCIRTHRSFIINKTKIKHLAGNRIFIAKHEIPVGTHYKEHLYKVLGL